MFSEERGVDSVDLLPFDWYVVQERLGASGIVAVGVIQGHNTLIRKEDLPLVPVNPLNVHQGPELVRKGSAGKGDSEHASVGDGVSLCFENKVGERRLKMLGVVERVENRRS